ncbi:hypothetical protein [Arthrobacter sp. SAFR-044]|uniref:hypothetical protein n=1 Tax=Arthrobacter sp. SAFR-044 TaxID=3387278 RepID=UPI003F7C6878
MQLHLTAELGPRLPVILVVRNVENLTTLLRTLMGVGVLRTVLDQLHDQVLDDSFGSQLIASPGAPLHLTRDSLVAILEQFNLGEHVDLDRVLASVNGVGYAGSAPIRSALANVLLDSEPDVLDTLAETVDAEWHLVSLSYRNPLDFLIQIAGPTAAAVVAGVAWLITTWQKYKKTQADIVAVNASTEKVRVETEIAKAKLGAEQTNAESAKVALSKQRVDLEAAKLALEMGRLELRTAQERQLDAVSLQDLRAINPAEAPIDVASTYTRATIAGSLGTPVSSDSRTLRRVAEVVRNLPEISDVSLDQ